MLLASCQILHLFVSLVCQLLFFVKLFRAFFDTKGIQLFFSALVVCFDVKMISRGLALNMLSQGSHEGENIFNVVLLPVTALRCLFH